MRPNKETVDCSDFVMVVVIVFNLDRISCVRAASQGADL